MDELRSTPQGTAQSAAPTQAEVENRRVWNRIPAEDLPELTARLATGASVRLLDLSRGGARFQCDRRLLPGAKVALTLVTPDESLKVHGRVVRSRMVRFDGRTASYEIALAFEQALTDFEGVPATAATEMEEIAPETTPDPLTADAALSARELELDPADVLAMTVSVTSISDELRQMFNGNEW